MAKVKVGDSVILKGYPPQQHWMNELVGREAEILDIWKKVRGEEKATILKLKFRVMDDAVYVSSRYVRKGSVEREDAA